MRLPTFLVIGAARSGTTTLHYCLGQHPEIFVSPIKETNFFMFDEAGQPPRWLDEAGRRLAPKTFEDYVALFAQATERHRAIGETSPGYLHGPVAPRIKARLPDAKLIAILRQPVDQALSIYATWQGGSVPADELTDRLADALEFGDPGPNGALPLAEHGLYHRHLAPYFEHFERRQIKVVLLDDLQQDGASLFADLFGFLGVDDGFRLEAVPRYNVTGAARSIAVHRALSRSFRIKAFARSMLPEPTIRALCALQHRIRSANLRKSSALSPELRRELTERFYGRDIAALERLLGRDLGIWLGPGSKLQAEQGSLRDGASAGERPQDPELATGRLL